jgi:hypothetical protein
VPSVEPHKRHDGFGWPDEAHAVAVAVVDAATEDELHHRGSLMMTESFGCFLELRIAQALRAYMDR